MKTTVIKNERARIIACPGKEFDSLIVLVPGVNVLSFDDARIVVNNPVMQKMFEANDLTVLETGTEDEENLDIKMLSVANALELVRDTYDHKLLAAWKEKENRKPVLSAITGQLDKIAKAKKE